MFSVSTSILDATNEMRASQPLRCSFQHLFHSLSGIALNDSYVAFILVLYYSTGGERNGTSMKASYSEVSLHIILLNG